MTIIKIITVWFVAIVLTLVPLSVFAFVVKDKEIGIGLTSLWFFLYGVATIVFKDFLDKIVFDKP